MNKYNIAEKFISINGEGRRAGQLAVFIRIAGCNLRCSYCDTLWASNKDYCGELLNADEILEYILKSGITNVTLTGGEPLLAENIEHLIALLVENNLWVEVETNGSVPLKPLEEKHRPHFTMDYKLPSSNFENAMNLDNFKHLNKNDVVKFVCGSLIDLNKAVEIIKKYDLLNVCKVYFSSVFGKITPEEIVEYMKKHKLNGVNLQLQMHKYIWSPDSQGV